jgi:hypothetical protein
MKPNITIKRVDIIRPVVQAQESPLNVAYANIRNNEENTNQTVVDIK